VGGEAQDERVSEEIQQKKEGKRKEITLQKERFISPKAFLQWEREEKQGREGERSFNT